LRYAGAFGLVVTMRHFVRFAKFSPCGSLARSGWRLRLFATWDEASAFARQMLGADWRVETGDFGDGEPEATRPSTAEPSLVVKLAQSLETASVSPRFRRA
jgi:hypothetical protein